MPRGERSLRLGCFQATLLSGKSTGPRCAHLDGPWRIGPQPWWGTVEKWCLWYVLVVFIWWKSWHLQISWDGFCFGFMLKDVVSKTHLVMACAWLAAQTPWSINPPGWNLSFLMSRYCVWLAARGGSWLALVRLEETAALRNLRFAWNLGIDVARYLLHDDGEEEETHFFGRDRGIWLCPAKSVGLLGIGARLWPMEMTFRKACSTQVCRMRNGGVLIWALNWRPFA